MAITYHTFTCATCGKIAQSKDKTATTCSKSCSSKRRWLHGGYTRLESLTNHIKFPSELLSFLSSYPTTQKDLNNHELS